MNGKPLFEGDREHIHHKLLKRGLTARQTTLVLYAVCAAFGLLSLFLLLPGGGPVVLVLVVLGGIVWIGVQHLGYHELIELRRVAQRTLDQKHVIVNNLSVRRAIADLADCAKLAQIQRLLESTFGNNDFDGYELEYIPATVDGLRAGAVRLVWCKPEAIGILGKPGVWRMELPLASHGKGRGHFRLYRTILREAAHVRQQPADALFSRRTGERARLRRTRPARGGEGAGRRRCCRPDSVAAV